MNSQIFQWAENQLSQYLGTSDERLPSLIGCSKEQILLTGFTLGAKHVQKAFKSEIENFLPDFVQLSHIAPPRAVSPSLEMHLSRVLVEALTTARSMKTSPEIFQIQQRLTDALEILHETPMSIRSNQPAEVTA